MKINNKILSVPPYISTGWNNITSLRIKDSVLLIQLRKGDIIEIPGLDDLTIQQIFLMHASALEEGEKITNLQTFPNPMETRVDVPFRLGVGLGSMQDIGSSIFQHDPSQVNAPTIPDEILEKIISITRIVTPDGLQVLSKAEEGCNCVHCQIAQVLVKLDESTSFVLKNSPPIHSEVVSQKELAFQQWDIKQTGDSLFSVTNKLDPYEHYSVFLGEPIGCTCGKTGCDHIVAVLKS